MIRKTIVLVLTLVAVGTVILWIASHGDDLRLETEAFDVAYQRLANARVATGEMKANRPADLYAMLNRLGTTEKSITEFQTLGWEDRLASPIAGTHLFLRDGIVVLDHLDYRPPPGWSPQGVRPMRVQRFEKRPFLFAWFHAPYAYRVTIEFPIWPLCVLVCVYPVLAFIRGPLRRYRRRKRGRCVRCGYDLWGLTEPRCPECGAETSSSPS